jgi:hypothetical protein
MQVQINTDRHIESLLGRLRDQRRRQAGPFPAAATPPDEQ